VQPLKIQIKKMKKILTLVFIGFLAFSCGKKDQKNTDSAGNVEYAADEDEENVNPENIQYKGTYKGKINGKEVELIINDETFNMSENGRHANGSWQKVNDGTIMGLSVKSGKISVKNWAYSDSNTWVALTDSLTYFEPEQYLKRAGK